MPSNIRIKRRLTGAAGAPSTLLSGEQAYNRVDGILYIGDGSAVVPIGGAHYATAAALATETSDRAAAISSENARAVAAELALGTRIDNVLHNVDGVALNSLSEVVVAFQAADGTLNGAITSLASSASSALTAEVSRATAAETALGVRIDGTVSAATALASRVTAAESDINTLESDLAAAVSAVTSSLNSEVSRATAAESALSGRVSALETEIDGGSF